MSHCYRGIINLPAFDGQGRTKRKYCQHWIKGDNRLPRESKDISELSRFLRFPVRKASICHIYIHLLTEMQAKQWK